MKDQILRSQLRRTLMFYQWHPYRAIWRLNELERTERPCVFPALMRKCLGRTSRVWSSLIMAPCCLSKQNAFSQTTVKFCAVNYDFVKPTLTICEQTTSQTLQIRSQKSHLKHIRLQRCVCVDNSTTKHVDLQCILGLAFAWRLHLWCWYALEGVSDCRCRLRVRLEGGAVHPLTPLEFYERRGLIRANVNTHAGQAQGNYLVLLGLIPPPPRAHIHGRICSSDVIYGLRLFSRTETY